jgi:hypothetical protein
MIYIGRIYGGPELSGTPVDQAIAKLVRSRGDGKATALGDFGSLDIVFHVAGSILQPEHTGVRTGRFSKRERMLQVQVAVPADVVASPDPYAFVASGVLEAVKAGAPIFAKAGIPYPLEEYVAVTEQMIRLGVQ